MSRAVTTTIFIIFIVGLAFVLGRQSVKPSANEPVVSSQVILERIQEQAYLVTKTLFLDEQVKIILQDAAGWQGFFTGDEIAARGLVRVDLGVDMRELSSEDIVINHNTREVAVFLPEPGILDSSLEGELIIENKKGIWTSLRDIFTADEGEDYNRAVESMVAQAEIATQAKFNILSEAKLATADLVKVFVASLAPGYQVRVSPK